MYNSDYKQLESVDYFSQTVENSWQMNLPIEQAIEYLLEQVAQCDLNRM